MRHKIITILLCLSIAYPVFGAITISDNFNDNSLDTGIWGYYNLSIPGEAHAEINQMTEMAVAPNTSGSESDLISNSNFNFDETEAHVKIGQVATPGTDTSLILYQNPNYGDRLMWLCSASGCWTYIQDNYVDMCGGTFCSSQSGLVIDADTAFRIKETGGTITFDYSENSGNNWTNSYSTTTANLTFSVNAMYVQLQVYEWSGTGATTEATSTFDEFNTLSGAPPDTYLPINNGGTVINNGGLVID